MKSSKSGPPASGLFNTEGVEMLRPFAFALMLAAVASRAETLKIHDNGTLKVSDDLIYEVDALTDLALERCARAEALAKKTGGAS